MRREPEATGVSRGGSRKLGWFDFVGLFLEPWAKRCVADDSFQIIDAGSRRVLHAPRALKRFAIFNSKQTETISVCGACTIKASILAHTFRITNF